MKSCRLFCQTLIVLLLIAGFVGCTTRQNEADPTSSTQPEQKCTAIDSDTSRDKRDYLWFLVLVIALYFTYRANRKANRLSQEISELRQVNKPVKRDEEPKYWLATALPKILIITGVVSGVVTIIVFSSYFVYFDGSIIPESDVWGQFGDFVGGTLNAVFGFFGFIMLLLTIIFQSRALQLSRQEIKSSKSSSQEQSKTLKLQQFEGTFFHLVTLHNNIVNSLELRETYLVESITRGQACLTKCYEIFKEEKYFEKYEQVKVKELPEIQKEILLGDSFKEFLFYLKTHHHLNVEHYFVHLCNMIEFLGKDDTQVFISESGTEDKRAKQRYMDIIRSQLSDAECVLLFFYCLSNSSKAGCKLMMEYGLLKNAPEVELVDAKYCEYYHDDRVIIDDP